MDYFDQQPPHSPEVELRTIGAMICDERAADIGIQTLLCSDFYLPQYRKVFEVIEYLRNDGQMLDDAIIMDRLRSLGWQKEYVEEVLSDAVLRTASAGAIETYCAELKNRAADRALIEDGQNRIKAGLAGRGREFIEEKYVSESQCILIDDLLHYDFENDPTLLIQGGWMTQGGLYGVIGQTGIGKSSFVMHAMLCFASGIPVFGITPIRPLKNLLIQGENATRIMARETIGVMCNVPGVNLDLIRQNVSIYRESRYCGDAFIRYIEAQIIKHRPDLAWIDPVFSYAGGNVNDQETMSKWLRNGLMALALEHKVSFIVVHHTPKPARDAKGKAAYAGGDWSYFGAGSAEFANACRGILTIRDTGEGLYELRAAKNQEGWPLTDSDEDGAAKVNTTLLRHGEKGIYWRRASAEETAAIRETISAEVSEILEEMRQPPSDGRGWRWTSSITMIMAKRHCEFSAAKGFFRNHVVKHLHSIAGVYTVKVSEVQSSAKSVQSTSEGDLVQTVHPPKGDAHAPNTNSETPLKTKKKSKRKAVTQ